MRRVLTPEQVVARPSSNHEVTEALLQKCDRWNWKQKFFYLFFKFRLQEPINLS